jgi:hypothetical protein
MLQRGESYQYMESGCWSLAGSGLPALDRGFHKKETCIDQIDRVLLHTVALSEIKKKKMRKPKRESKAQQEGIRTIAWSLFPIILVPKRLKALSNFFQVGAVPFPEARRSARTGNNHK